MAVAMSTTRMRLERLADERDRTQEKIEDARKLAEDEKRDLNEFESEQIGKYRTRVADLEEEINQLASDLERVEKTRDVSELIRGDAGAANGDGKPSGGVVVYRTFAQYARDRIIVDHPLIAANAARDRGDIEHVMEAARERLEVAKTKERALQHTLSSDVAGLLPPQHLAQIMDIINRSRPVVQSARRVNLESGRLTYPKIAQRPEVLKQSAEKTEAGTANMQFTLEQLIADTYLGGGNLSWQVINWSTPDALQLWFDLAAEAYARETETAACSELGTAAGGTITTPLGTAGTESFAQWRAAAIAAISSIYNTTGGRAITNTIWLAAHRFFQLAGLGTDQTLQVSSVGNLDISTMTGTWAGLRVVGSYGFTNANAAIVGDANAFLVAESPGAPVELRAVEPAIGGMEVGVIGGFKSKVFDSERFIHLS